MPKITNISTGEMAVGNDSSIIKTVGIGSCIVVALYDKENRIGAMSHSLLPFRREQTKINSAPIKLKKTAKYVDESINWMIEEIEKLGGKKENLTAKLIGGSRMFKILSGDKYGIGYQNIQAANQKLGQLGIPIESEATGGTVGRMAEMNLANGIVDIDTKI